jgi:hypothetical protein
MRRTISVALAIIILAGFAPVASAAKRFNSCAELWESNRFTLIAKDDASRTRYIKYQIDNFYEPKSVRVRRKFYQQNRHLDSDRDGVLCEDYVNKGYETAMKLGRAMCLAFNKYPSAEFDRCMRGGS